MTVVRVPITTIRERVRALTGRGPFAAPTLDHRYQRRESCEGYSCGCGYGAWQANDTLPVYSAERDTSHVAFHLRPGERLDAQPGYHHVLRPAVVIVFDTLKEYMANIPPTTRSSLLIDLEQGKRIEVEALQGAAVRRAARHGVPVPIVSTLYALLKAWESGPVR